MSKTLIGNKAKKMLEFLLDRSNGKDNYKIYAESKYRCKGIYKGDILFVVFDNSGGNCNVEEFASELKANEWLSGASFTERDYLCQCTNCGTILIDESPQVGAKKFILSGNEITMERFCDEDGGFWGCPKCETDSYLVDPDMLRITKTNT
ncbi:hypothetical protein [Bacteroides sp. 51]|uniref:hypothetical protein n=1 Tax=Bacteroides sp. 51 TaxID=2302938 RepID=UPI0013D30F56|nr:hypothetical protein [Bacteroides sp. 51]NDV80777.1 hypothetical protein [Bacteroides sp. 51]